MKTGAPQSEDCGASIRHDGWQKGGYSRVIQVMPQEMGVAAMQEGAFFLNILLDVAIAIGTCSAAWAAFANIRRINNPSLNVNLIFQSNPLADSPSCSLRLTNTCLSAVIINDIKFGFGFGFGCFIKKSRPLSDCEIIDYASFPLLIERGKCYDSEEKIIHFFSMCFEDLLGDEKGFWARFYYLIRKFHRYNRMIDYFIFVHMQNGVIQKYKLDTYERAQVVPRIQERFGVA